MSETPGHGDDHHEDFDPEPAQALGADEPRTPSWMPVFGACLFLFGTVVFLVRFSDTGPKDAASSASAVAKATATAAPKPLPATSQGRKAPPQDASGRARLLENIKKEREKAAASASGAAPSASASTAPPLASASASAPPKPRKPPTAAPLAPPSIP